MKQLYILFLTILISGISFGQNLVITGLYDGPLTGGTPKGVELYVLSDIADLSIYGLGSANNGGGSDGEEFTFPADAVSAGDFIYVASESTNFNTFFGFVPNYTSSAMSINGDDAVELFMNGSVVDLFGDINTDGSGTSWDYQDGWAYRNDKVAPNPTFTSSDWTFSGINALDNEATNASATTPFPIGTYVASTAAVTKNQIAGFAMYPNPVNNGKFVITSNNGANKQVEIYSMIGKQVYSKTVKANETIDVSNLNQGIYVLRVIEDNKIATRKLIVN